MNYQQMTPRLRLVFGVFGFLSIVAFVVFHFIALFHAPPGKRNLLDSPTDHTDPFSLDAPYFAPWKDYE